MGLSCESRIMCIDNIGNPHNMIVVENFTLNVTLVENLIKHHKGNNQSELNKLISHPQNIVPQTKN